MGLYQHLAENWKKALDEGMQRERLIKWRRQPVTLRLEHPTRLDRARALGFKAKQGVFVVRQRVSRGPHRRTWTGGRKSKNMRTLKALRKNYRMIAEERASMVFTNCEALNSYYVGEDGKHFWYEVIMVDRSHPAVLTDHRLAWIATQRGRAHRGLTSAGRTVRGLRWKGKGAEKARPSRRAHDRRL